MNKQILFSLLVFSFLAGMPCAYAQNDTVVDDAVIVVQTDESSERSISVDVPATKDDNVSKVVEEAEAPEPEIVLPSTTELPVVKLRTLDKVTARTGTFQAPVGSTVKFGSLYIKARTCRESSPLENPESAAFLQIWQLDKEEKSQWVFSGWMFASSPGLSAMDHPIYDVWVLGCQNKKAAPDKAEAAEQKKRGEGEVSEDMAPAKPDGAE